MQRRSLPVAVITLVCAVAPRTGLCQQASGDLLYRMTLLRAAPGKLLELVNEVRGVPGRVSRPRLILRHAQGDQWDLFTIGAYRSWKHYAERDDVPPQRSGEAARAAGFAGDEQIGPYLRALIQQHHDTLAMPVR